MRPRRFIAGCALPLNGDVRRLSMQSSRESKFELTVRVATAADVEALIELMHEFYAESNFPLDRAWTAEAFHSLLAKPELGRVWIATSCGIFEGWPALSAKSCD